MPSATGLVAAISAPKPSRAVVGLHFVGLMAVAEDDRIGPLEAGPAGAAPFRGGDDARDGADGLHLAPASSAPLWPRPSRPPLCTMPFLCPLQPRLLFARF